MHTFLDIFKRVLTPNSMVRSVVYATRYGNNRERLEENEMKQENENSEKNEKKRGNICVFFFAA